MRRYLATALAAVVFAFTGSAFGQQQPQQTPKRDLIKITDNLYRFQNNFHFGVVYVTPAGVIVGDTIDTAAATWLKDEIAKRFNQPVKYVFLSHDHDDHTSGAEVFANAGVPVISHAAARAKIAANRPPAAVPTITFADRLDINLGGKTVELHYVGKNHSDNTIVARFPAERALFAVDWIPVKALAFREMRDSHFPDWNEGLKRVEAMDFDILTPGHGNVGTKADVAAFRGYLEDLQAAVRKAKSEGKTVDQAKAEIKLDKYKDWGQYEQFLPLNVQGMYGYIN
jgi:glyoxylase-like metal-dependent hydrolase (beta-lactamase superfamily II)